MTPVRAQHLENAALALLVAVLFVGAGFDWWWLLLCFVVFDLSALGYLRNPKFGAFCYNLVHHYAPPALLAILYWALRSAGIELWILGLLAGSWAFHIAVDRALGYGLKYDDNFQHTHLAWLGASGRSVVAPPSPSEPQ
ncbi:hypothetical protein FHU41_001645 [Psychromicrobium silvestre]|uniref:DUF4260 family protein n=1 Tax=Psychromicrobium silvestre TaxID=1645614 RepID=A0A7Y9LTJ2_9MICC|nr:DUF4260 domain-containing protein [Psychromicrobium silvestre]NYE95379.1 hypothetical protein [Psychromicrobium silvestre]NYE95395.1 hypothetical protein [Psychromicrobium silvestre]